MNLMLRIFSLSRVVPSVYSNVVETPNKAAANVI